MEEKLKAQFKGVVEPPVDIEAVREAARQKNLDAILQLAVAYEDGDGVEQDEEKAAELYEEYFDRAINTALGGDRDVQHNIALLYMEGYGALHEHQPDQAGNEPEAVMDWAENALKEDEGFAWSVRDAYLHEDGRKEDQKSDQANKKLQRLYELKKRLERQGFDTGANRDYETAEHES